MSNSVCLDELTPDQLYSLNEEIVPGLYEPLSPQSRTIARLFGNTLRARNLDTCNKIGRYGLCDAGCPPTLHICRCGQRFCETCSCILVAQTVRRWKYKLDSIASIEHETPLIHLKMYLPMEHAHDADGLDAERELVRDISQSIASMIHRADPDSKVILQCAGFNRGHLTLRVTYIGRILSASRLHQMFPVFKVSHQFGSGAQVAGFFRRTIEPLLPESSQERGEMEYLFRDTSQLITRGIDKISPLESNTSFQSSAAQPIPADGSSSNVETKRLRYKIPCSTCQEFCLTVTSEFPLTGTLPPIGTLRRFRIDGGPPQ